MNAHEVRAVRRSLVPTAAEIGRRKEERAPFYPQKGLTLREAAARIGVHLTTWHRWEHGGTVTDSKRILLQIIRQNGGTARPFTR